MAAVPPAPGEPPPLAPVVNPNGPIPPAAPVPNTVPSPDRADNARPVIPYLIGEHLAQFGLRENTRLTYNYVLWIGGQDTVAEATYNQMLQLVNAILPLTVDEFQRMWKTLILKRVQDVFEKEKSRRAPHRIVLNRVVHVPAPLNDLLHAIGSFTSKSSGFTIHVIPPPFTPPDQGWWYVDSDLVNRWCTMMHRMSKLYTIAEFPSVTDYEDRPLPTLLIEDDDDDIRSVYSFTDEPSPTDNIIRFVNDEMFDPANHVTVQQSSYLLVDHEYRPTIIANYVGSYVISSNS